MASHAAIPLEKNKNTKGVSVWYVFTLCFISLAIALGFTIVYVKHVQDEAKRNLAAQSRVQAAQQAERGKQLCAAMDIMQNEYADLGTKNAAEIADKWGEIEKLIGCPGHDGNGN